jgi:predicted AlkP superfamily pyrophosphatase or phosphodiesterase
MTWKYCRCYILLFFIATSAVAQTAKPKLVVGLVIDQMRWDYLYRYNDLYGPDGFKRLMGQGHTCENTFIPYIPTYTAIGHSCVYTGSIPALSGIVGNNWFDRRIARNVYCTDDSTVSSVGTTTVEGKMSPQNLWVTTIGDELRLSNNFKSKVIGVAVKDRASILPAGHSANAAYWYDDTIGRFISSSYYMNELPDWVKNFNDKNFPSAYMSKEWNTLLPIQKYDLSTADNVTYESRIPGETSSIFPHKFSQTGSQRFEAFKYTPFAVTYTFDFAKEIIEKERMGSNNVTDFLAVSISPTDYVGHTFGPNSIEAEDTYLRLDRDIASFLNYLDQKIGKGNYTIFLTADHGVAHVPGFSRSHKIPSATFNEWDLRKEINDTIQLKYGIRNVVMDLQNYQVYINTKEIEREGKDIVVVKQAIMNLIQEKPFVLSVFEMAKAQTTTLPEPVKTRVINSYNTKRSGDIQFIIKANYFDGGATGTTHGLWNPYDSHIPLLWYGWGIKPGKTNRETYMTDIAATLASLLKIQMPNGCVGKVIAEVIK